MPLHLCNCSPNSVLVSVELLSTMSLVSLLPSSSLLLRVVPPAFYLGLRVTLYQLPRMPRDEVDVRNIVSSKRVPRVALRLLDPLNGADAANAARQPRLSTTTVQSLDAVEQGQTASVTRDPLPEQALPLKRQAHTNEIEDEHATKRARSTVSTPGTTTPPYSPTIEVVEDDDEPTPAPACRPQKRLTIIASDEENEETGSTISTDNAAQKCQNGFSSGSRSVSAATRAEPSR
ncbi:hypothetical protein F5888DRAFT_1873131 [Russula emetica]|nr:hypothetical protein F5888DRAFT_1873131 [Russula emetica]